jgi:hypothetical protein
MKKIIIVLYLVITVLPTFSQDMPPDGDDYTKFQGIWYGVIYDEDPVFFVFIDDIFICNLDYGFSCRYSVENHNLIVTSGRELLVSGWGDTKYNPDTTNNNGKIQYIFSGERLVLVFDGEPITLSKDYTDFPEWR